MYLACTGRPHPREVLAELLWPRTLASPVSGQSAHGSQQLRQVPSYVHTTRHTIALLGESSVWLDVAEFERLIALAGISERRETILPDDKARTLANALDPIMATSCTAFTCRTAAHSKTGSNWSASGCAGP